MVTLCLTESLELGVGLLLLSELSGRVLLTKRFGGVWLAKGGLLGLLAKLGLVGLSLLTKGGLVLGLRVKSILGGAEALEGV